MGHVLINILNFKTFKSCILFSPMVSGLVCRWREISCLDCISETLRCKKFILGGDVG